MILGSVDDAIDNFVEDIKKELHGRDIRIQYLTEQNKELYDEHYKDNELYRMKKSLEEMQKKYNRGFPISKQEEDKINKWIENHEAEVHHCHSIDDRLRRGGCIGGTYTYEFIPTSIGTIGTIKCSCGAEFTFQEMV